MSFTTFHQKYAEISNLDVLSAGYEPETFIPAEFAALFTGFVVLQPTRLHMEGPSVQTGFFSHPISSQIVEKHT